MKKITCLSLVLMFGIYQAVNASSKVITDFNKESCEHNILNTQTQSMQDAAIADVEIVKSGVGGNTSGQMLSRINSSVFEYNPTTTIMLAGTNDFLNSGKLTSLEDFEDNYRNIVDQIIADGGDLLLMSIPPVIESVFLERQDDPTLWEPDGPNARVILANQIVTQVANEKNITLIDTYNLFKDNPDLISNDGLHQNDEGSQRMSDLIRDAFVETGYSTSKIVCFGDSITNRYPDFLYDTLINNPVIPQQCDSHDGLTQIEAEGFCEQLGVEIVSSAIGFINNGDWVKFENVNFSSGVNSIEMSVSSGTSGGSIEIRGGSTLGTLLGAVEVPNTGSFTTWETVTTNISGAVEVQDIYLMFVGGTGYLFDVDWFQFSSSTLSVSNPSIGDVDTVLIYPNPISLTTIIENADNTSLIIYDMNGSVVLTKSILSDSEVVDLDNVSSGFYCVEVRGEGTTSMVKLVKE